MDRDRSKAGYQSVTTDERAEDAADEQKNNNKQQQQVEKQEEEHVASSSVTVTIERPAWTQREFDAQHKYNEPEQSPGILQTAGRLAKENCRCTPKSFILSLFPVLGWIHKYSIKQNLLSDVISGFTVAVMHIPQGMAYALLAGVPPIVGIYMAFFPVLVYFVMGTSRHVSMGSFAVVSIMTGKIVTMYAKAADHSPGITYNDTIYDDVVIEDQFDEELPEDIVGNHDLLTPIQVATAVCLAVGLWQIIMGVFRLGVLSMILSDTLVSGFTTGAACHVFTSQVKNLLGLKVPRFNGPFKLVFTYIAIFTDIPNTNVIAVALSAVFIFLLFLSNEYVKPWMSKRTKFPFPSELIAVVSGTLVSRFIGLGETYNVNVVGEIPTGFPEPVLPPVWLLPEIMLNCLMIAVVAYCISLSMAKIFAQKQNYEVDANQELLALGTGNIVGSMFSCIPFAASLSRSLIQEAVGGKTQIASLVSCSLLVLVLLVIGPFFEPLPNCVLSSIIIVALKGMFLQVKDLTSAWTKSKVDAIIWFVTFASVVLLDIDYGLGIGVAVSLFAILYMGHQPYFTRLGVVPTTDVYLDVDRYEAAMEYPGICILRYSGGLHFANRDSFKEHLYTLIGFDPRKLLISRNKMMAKQKKEMKVSEKKGHFVTNITTIGNSETKNHFLASEDECAGKVVTGATEIYTVILDMTAVSFVDPSSVKTLQSIAQELHSVNVNFYLAGCSGPVIESLNRSDFTKSTPDCLLFPSIHDAVTISENRNEPSATVKQ